MTVSMDKKKGKQSSAKSERVTGNSSDSPAEKDRTIKYSLEFSCWQS